MIIDESAARRVLAAVDAGELPELGEPIPIRRLVHHLHGARWSSPHAQARGLRRLAVAALGSQGALDEIAFARSVAQLAIQWCVPVALRAAAQCRRAGAQRERLLKAAELCAREPTREHALEANAIRVAYTYGWAAAEATDAATHASLATAWAAEAARAADNAAAWAAVAARDAYTAAAVPPDAYATGWVTDAATYAADTAVCAAKAMYAAATSNDGRNDVAARAAYDDTLGEFAERVVHVLCDLGSPGCAFLHLTEE